MELVINSGKVQNNLNTNFKKKILIAGCANTDLYSRQIFAPASKEEALSLYGQSELYESYCLLKDFNINDIYTVNCYNRSDYIRLIDKVIHYDFDYFVPINIYMSDKFYNPISKQDTFYASYFIEQLYSVNSLTTVIMTERHASLFEDFDHFTLSMKKVETDFLNSYTNKTLLNEYGNNLIFIVNNLRDIPYANIVLSGLFYNRDYGKYLPSIKRIVAEYEINNIDFKGFYISYFKNNYYAGNVTVENLYNYKLSNDIYSNALIDDVIKRVIKSINLDKYKGRLHNAYTALQIEAETTKALNNLKTKLYKDYKINKISFNKTSPTSGYIMIDYSIVPYGTLESLNILMGV